MPSFEFSVDISVGSVGINERGFPKDVSVTDAWWFAGFFGGATGERGFPRDVAFTSGWLLK